METKEYRTIDRTEKGWPQGPWDSEPDKMQWPDAATGLPCLAVRHERMGHWCGYVGVPEGHPKFGASYNDVDVEVHGGLTFAAACRPGAEDKAVCHVPGPGESDKVWWLGFDCAHSWDLSPEDATRSEREGGIWKRGAEEEYRTLNYVKNQCANLARQLSR